MSVKRFFSATSREAIKQVRAEMGDEAVILSNQKVDGGVEVIASAHNDIAALIDRSPRLEAPATPASPAPDAPVDPATLTTMARIAQATQAKLAKVAALGSARRAPADARVFKPGEVPAAESFAHFVQRNEVQRGVGQRNEVQRAVETRTAPAATSPRKSAATTQEAASGSESNSSHSQLVAEIQQMKSILQEQMGVMSWNETASRRPLQAKQISQMLSAGFSPALARALADKLPADYNEPQAATWLHDSLLRNLQVSPAESDLVDRGGVYALVGPTGVGKTTTAAKLAARCVLKNGARSLGLITVDNYRIGAEDQLRAYGKILGVTVHTAHDAQTLADLIALMRDKHLVLIDTVGMGQRDSRLAAQIQMLNSPSIEPVLFLNASAQGETLEDVVRLYGGQGHRRTTKVILSKIDEAVKFGFALDCVIRHKLQIQYVTNGQRVPEDLHPANAKYLVHCALKHRAAPAFALDDAEIPLVLSKAALKPGTVLRHA
ncbi:MAG: flagellar biosynthesis protein FlhF [Betaproteobacteria bacterium]|nr:flagellar biosynthesis protein FlhF [Betaproteobacteria bacterium]